MIVGYLVSLVGSLIGWGAFAYATYELIGIINKKFGKESKIRNIFLVVILVVLYASYNAFVISPLLNKR